MQTVTPAKNYTVIIPSQKVQLSPTTSLPVAMGQVNQAALYVDFTLGSLTSLEFSIQGSYDGVKWYSKTVLDIANGSSGGGFYIIPTDTAVFSLTNNNHLVIDIPSCYQYMRVVYEGQGESSNSNIFMALGAGSI